MRTQEKIKRNEKLVQMFLEKGHEMSLAEIGAKFNITRQRVSEILKNKGIAPINEKNTKDIKNMKVLGTSIANDELITLKLLDLKKQRDKANLKALNMANTLKYREAKIERLEKDNAELKKENTELKKQVEDLRKSVKDSVNKALEKVISAIEKDANILIGG